MKLVLRERLYVPEELVTDDIIAHFTYQFAEREIERDANGKPIGVGKNFQTVKTVMKIRNPNDDKYYYGFARGNLPKLKEYFGDFEWEDRTVSPKMVGNLQFRKDRHLKNFEKDGVGQEEVVAQVLKNPNGVIKAAPRFGKTVCTVYIATKLRLKTLIIAHQHDLLRQFYQEFIDFTNLAEIKQPQINKQDARGQVVGFFSDYKNPEELDVCLLCWQTLGSKLGPQRIAKHRDTWGIIISDEVHKLGASKYASVINRLNSKHRLGLTGTLKRVDDREKIVLDIVGPVIAKGKVNQVPCAVTVIHTGTNVKYDMVEPLVYLHKRLYNNQERLKTVLKYLAEDVRDGFFICIGFHRSSQEQLQEFTDVLKFLGYKAEAFYGSMKRNREEVLQEFRDGNIQIAVCNEAMLTGINVPRWNVYYSMFPTSSVAWDVNDDGTMELSGNFKQNADRVRTPFWYTATIKKKVALIRDFVDNNKHCKNAYRKRLRAYKHQKFEIEHIYENIKENICG